MNSNSLCGVFLLVLLPIVLALPPLQSDATQISLHDLLVSHGIQDGQMALVMVAPISHQQALAAQSGALQSQLLSRLGQTAQPLLVQSSGQPVDVHYKSQSTPLNIQHTHIPAPTPELQLSRSEEEPHRLVHEIVRPVIQEVREIIQPYRRIVQEIRPVQESIVQKVAKNPQAPLAAGVAAYPAHG